MPPKKGNGGGNGGEKKERKPIMVDNIPTTDMTLEQLEEHCLRMREEMDREREERNFYQLERDKVSTFWEITKRQLEERKAELRNKDRELEEAEEKHQVEIKVYKQRIKHLLYEHQSNLAELRAQSLLNMKLAEQDHLAAERLQSKDKRNLKIKMKEDELVQLDTIKEVKLNHSEQLTELRLQFEKNLAEIEDRYDKKMRNLHDELDLRRKTEIHEVEERKNQQMNNLMKNHEKAFTEIKNYYNDITVNNLALINTLKEQAEELKKRHDYLERLLNESSLENKKLHDQLQQCNQKIVELKKYVELYDNSRITVSNLKAKLKTTSEDLKGLTWEQEVTEQRFKQVEKERDEIYAKFISSIQEVQQKSMLKNVILEKKLETLAESLEKKEAQLSEVLAACGLDTAALATVTKKLEDLLDSKNNTIKDLQLEIARVSKAHDDILRAFDVKLQQLGARTDDLGFQPLGSSALGQKIRKGPAGLVAACPL